MNLSYCIILPLYFINIYVIIKYIKILNDLFIFPDVDTNP